eukprot:gene1512-1763_t
MDNNLIHLTIQAFSSTLHHDETIRTRAEEQLKQLKVIEGYAQVLLRIIASNEVDLSVRQAGSIFLKNMTINRWRGYEPDHVMSDADAQFLKDNILEALVHTHHLVRNQVTHMIEIIANRDFPNKWEKLLDQAISYITSNNETYVLGGLIALQVSIKKFQFIPSGEARREPLNAICEKVLPLCLAILDHLAATPSQESAVMQRKICKIFFYTINFDVPPVVVQPALFDRWMAHFFRVIQTPCPAEACTSADDTIRHPWWTLKKCVGRILNTLLRKTGKVRKADGDTRRQLAALFIPRYAIATLDIFLTALRTTRANLEAYANERYVQYLLEYFTNALSYGSLYPTLKPAIPSFLSDIVLPFVVFTEHDAELYEDDPHEYLRSQYDSMKEHYSPRMECHNFVIALVQKRGRAHLDLAMNLCIQYLQRGPRDKFGALALIGTLSSFLMRVSMYRSNLETMLARHVLPELTSPHGYLRGQAAWLFSEFYNITFTDATTFSNGLRHTLTLMSDSELPVRVRAGASICNLVRAKQGTDELRPVLPQLLDKIFTLMGEIESEDLVTTLDSIIRKYNVEIAPYALNLATKLAETLFRLLDGDDNDTTAMAAQECLSTFRSLVRAMIDVPSVFCQLETVIVPVLDKILVPEQLMFLEEALRILTFLTFYPKTISPLTWTLFPKIVAIFNDSAADMIDSMINPLDNYISYGNEQFLAPGTPYLGNILDMYAHMVADHRMPAYETGEACKLSEALMQRCRGRIDGAIPKIVELAVRRLLDESKENQMSKELSVYLLEVVSNALYYNAAITIDYLQRAGLVEAVFGKWFALFKRFQRFYDKKIALLGLSSLLTIQPAPQFVLGGAKILLTKIMFMMKEMLGIEKQMEKDALAEEKEGGDDDDDEDDEDDEDYDIGQDFDEEHEFIEVADNEDADDPEEAYLGDLEKMVDYTIELGDDDFEGGEFADDGSEAEVEGEDNEEEELFENEESGGSFETPIDDVDELEYMVNSFQFFFVNNPTMVSQHCLDAKQQKKITQYIALIPVRKAKEEAERKKEEEADAKRQAKRLAAASAAQNK